MTTSAQFALVLPDNVLTRDFIVFERNFFPLAERIIYVLPPFDGVIFGSVQAIIDFSMKKAEAKLRRSNRDSDESFLVLLSEHLNDFERFLREFLEQAYSLWSIFSRLKLDVQQQGDQARFLMQLNEHPIVQLILRQMRCSHGVGGQMTIAKKLFGRSTWSEAKLQLFFTNLKHYLKEQVAYFLLPSKEQLKAHVAYLDLKMEALTNPDFGKPQLTDFETQVDEVVRKFVEEAATKFLKNLPDACTKKCPKP